MDARGWRRSARGPASRARLRLVHSHLHRRSVTVGHSRAINSPSIGRTRKTFFRELAGTHFLFVARILFVKGPGTARRQQYMSGQGMRTLYDVLGVRPDVDGEAIRLAFRTLAKAWHPDVNPGDRWSEQWFKQITTAYVILGHPGTRRAYDARLARSRRGRRRDLLCGVTAAISSLVLVGGGILLYRGFPATQSDATVGPTAAMAAPAERRPSEPQATAPDLSAHQSTILPRPVEDNLALPEPGRPAHGQLANARPDRGEPALAKPVAEAPPPSPDPARPAGGFAADVPPDRREPVPAPSQDPGRPADGEAAVVSLDGGATALARPARAEAIKAPIGGGGRHGARSPTVAAPPDSADRLRRGEYATAANAKAKTRVGSGHRYAQHRERLYRLRLSVAAAIIKSVLAPPD